MALQLVQFLFKPILPGDHQPHEYEDDGKGQAVRGEREL
jgi:hypothetical protein